MTTELTVFYKYGHGFTQSPRFIEFMNKVVNLGILKPETEKMIYQQIEKIKQEISAHTNEDQYVDLSIEKINESIGQVIFNLDFHKSFGLHYTFEEMYLLRDLFMADMARIKDQFMVRGEVWSFTLEKTIYYSVL